MRSKASPNPKLLPMHHRLEHWVKQHLARKIVVHPVPLAGAEIVKTDDPSEKVSQGG